MDNYYPRHKDIRPDYCFGLISIQYVNENCAGATSRGVDEKVVTSEIVMASKKYIY